MVRSFVAVKIPPNPSLAEAISELRAMGRGLRAVDSESTHITLKFLGEVEESGLPSIVEAIRSAASGNAPVEMELEGVGCFPDEGRPAVVWAGSKGGERLGRIVEALEGTLEGIGFPRERRRFVAHLTLGRVKGQAPRELPGFLARHRSTRFGKARIEAIHLFKSELLPGGPRYTVIDSVGLV
jgi:2'-5' RNA ligase